MCSEHYSFHYLDSHRVESSCNYRRNDPNVQMCGPGDIFTSSVTDENGDPNNSSLSVDSVTSDLSGTSVTCIDGNAIIIGSRNICVIGKMECHEAIQIENLTVSTPYETLVTVFE